LKLIELAQNAVRLLKESGEEGIRSDVLADHLDTPKRRIYDVIAVLKSLDQVETKRRFDGTTITWIDQTKNHVVREEFEAIKAQFEEVNNERMDLQLEVAQLKEQLRITRSRLKRDVMVVESAGKTEFDTTQIRVRALSSSGIKRVRDSGIEVVIETNEPGMIIDPTVIMADENEALLRNLQRL
jgi:regulator of replication initiation timing